MLELCKSSNKVPVFYAYVIAFEARSNWQLSDCDNPQGKPTLCQKGSEYIRQNKNHLIGRYYDNAANIARVYGSDKVVVFLIEPDLWYENKI